MNDQAKQVVNITESMRVVSRELTPMDMLHQAVSQGANIDVLSKLMDLSERWEKNQARKAFDVAIAGAKSEIPVIEKNRNVKFKAKSGGSDTDYWHEDLAQIARTIDPILSKHGLSYRFRATSAPNEPVSVTCVLSHILGHFEETTLRGPPDSSGNKNPHQAIASACTLLQRYTLRLAVGLAAGRDDAGEAAGEGESITEEQVKELTDLITKTGGDVAKFCEFAKVPQLADIASVRFEAAKDAINRAAAARAKKATEK